MTEDSENLGNRSAAISRAEARPMAFPAEDRERSIEMLKLLTRLFDRLAKPLEPDFCEPDLLQHPALERMSERELADLPFTPVERQACCAP